MLEEASRGRPLRAPRCSLCRDDLEEGESIHDCSGCATRFHLDCVIELGGCATLGCPELGRRVGARHSEHPARLSPERLEELRAQVRAEEAILAARRARYPGVAERLERAQQPRNVSAFEATFWRWYEPDYFLGALLFAGISLIFLTLQLPDSTSWTVWFSKQLPWLSPNVVWGVIMGTLGLILFSAWLTLFYSPRILSSLRRKRRP